MTDTKHQAFALYVQKGLSLRQIAVELRIGKATAERWSSAECWGIQRQRAWRARREAVMEKHVLEENARDKSIAGELFCLFKEAARDRQSYYEGKIPRRALRFSTRDLCNLAKALVAVGDSDLRKVAYEDFRKGRIIPE